MGEAHLICGRVLLKAAGREIAGSASWSNYLAEAIQEFRGALGVYRQVSPEGLEVADVLEDLSRALSIRRDSVGAATCLGESLAIRAKLRPPYANAVENATSQLANLQEQNGNLQLAIGSWRRAVELLPEDDASITSVTIRLRLAMALRHTSQPEEAEHVSRKVIALITNKMRSPKAEPRLDMTSLGGAHVELAVALADQGQFSEAVKSCRQAITLAETNGFSAWNYRTVLGRTLAAWALAEEGGGFSSSIPSEAIARAQEAELLLRAEANRVRADANRGDLGLAMMAVAYADSKTTADQKVLRLQEAEPLLLAGYQAREREAGFYDNSIELRTAAQRLVRLYTLLNRPDDVAKWRFRETTITAKDSTHSRTNRLHP